MMEGVRMIEEGKKMATCRGIMVIKDMMIRDNTGIKTTDKEEVDMATVKEAMMVAIDNSRRRDISHVIISSSPTIIESNRDSSRMKRMIIIRKMIEIIMKSRRSRYLQLPQRPMKTLSPGKEMEEAEEGAKSSATTKQIVSTIESSRWRTIVSTEKAVATIKSSTNRDEMTSREMINKMAIAEGVVARDEEEEEEMTAHLVKISNLTMKKRVEATNRKEVVAQSINRKLGEAMTVDRKQEEAEKTTKDQGSSTNINK